MRNRRLLILQSGALVAGFRKLCRKFVPASQVARFGDAIAARESLANQSGRTFRATPFVSTRSLEAACADIQLFLQPLRGSKSGAATFDGVVKRSRGNQISCLRPCGQVHELLGKIQHFVAWSISLAGSKLASGGRACPLRHRGVTRLRSAGHRLERRNVIARCGRVRALLVTGGALGGRHLLNINETRRGTGVRSVESPNREADYADCERGENCRENSIHEIPLLRGNVEVG